MKDRINKYIWIILAIVLFFSFSYASAQQEQTESMDAKAYYNRGVAYGKKGQYDQAISDFTKALKINPMLAGAYYNRGVTYYYKKEYRKSLEDVEKAHNLGYQISPKFLETLRKASGRRN